MFLSPPESVRRQSQAPASAQDTIQTTPLDRPSTAPSAPQGSTKSLLEKESNLQSTDATTNVSTASDPTHAMTSSGSALNEPTEQEIAENPWKYSMYWIAAPEFAVIAGPKLYKIYMLICYFSWLPAILPMGRLRSSMVYHPTFQHP